MPEEFDLLGMNWEDIPKSAEVESTFYKHLPGAYLGFQGTMRPHYMDINNKACAPSTPGARFHHASIPLWLAQSHGTPEAPKTTDILGMDLIIPPDKKSFELYFSLYITWESKDTWRMKQMFQNYEIKGDPESRIVTAKRNAPGDEIHYNRLEKYYGKLIYFVLIASDKGTIYVDTKNFPLKIAGDGVSVDKMKKFELAMQDKIQKERTERENNSNNSEYIPPTTEGSEDSSDLESFLGG